MNRFPHVAALAAAALLATPLRAQTAPDSALAPQACTARVPGVNTSTWQQVRAEGFTFCVPASWRARGVAGADGTAPKTWTGGTGTVMWGTGTYRPASTRGPVRSSGDDIVRQTTVARSSSDPETRIDKRNETIGGLRAEVWEYVETVDGERRSGARWDRPRVYLSAAARDDVTADLQKTVLRTVQFTAAPAK